MSREVRTAPAVAPARGSGASVPAPRAIVPRAVLAPVLAALVWLGWRELWFLCDDAFICFRYAANHLRGWGFTWNPPPFVPVDGTTDFLWVVLLRAVWGTFGIEPPAAAPVLGLAFGLVALALAWAMLERMELPRSHERWRLALLATALLGIATNRTFLTWLSSGLGSALFNALLMAVLLVGTTAPERRGPWWTLRLASAAQLLALTRPDSLPFLGMALVVLGRHVLRQTAPAARRRALLGLAPLAIEPLYLGWHHVTYGGLLPNTYHAKHVGAWPESGVRYLGSFVVEYGVWVWALLALGWGVPWLLRPAALVRAVRERLDLLLLCVAIAFHFGYSTFSIGGDYFEYRIYSYAVPLLFVSGAWMAARVARRPAVSLGLLGAFVLASWPVAWTHWAVAPRSRRENLRAGTFELAPHFPALVRPLLEPYDAWQQWLFAHFVCVRQPVHASMCAYSLARMPAREVGARIRWEPDHPTIGLIGVGVPGWLMPEVAVIDLLGLNDRVVARSPVNEGERHMAHDRKAPDGYLEAFRPNVRFERRGKDYAIVVDPRETPLTDADIRAIEERFWAEVRGRASR